MKTAKWFKVGIPLPIKDIAQKLQVHSFKEGLRVGFILKKITGIELTGQYIEQKTFIKEVTNPFGSSQTFEIPDFQIIDFRIICIDHVWLLEIQNAPRSIKPLIYALSKIVGFGFYADNVEIDLNDLICELEHKVGKLSITRMEIYNINIQNNALGQMTITSTKDVRLSLDSYLLTDNYKIKSICARFLHHDVLTGVFEIKNNSRVEIGDPMPRSRFLTHYIPILARLTK